VAKRVGAPFGSIVYRRMSDRKSKKFVFEVHDYTVSDLNLCKYLIPCTYIEFKILPEMKILDGVVHLHNPVTESALLINFSSGYYCLETG